jgi:glucose/arabinose dehydrogenase
MRPTTTQATRAITVALLLLPILVGSPQSASALDRYGERLVVDGLTNAAAFTFAPDGRIFIAERITGNIRVFNPATGALRLFATVPDVVGTVFTELGLDGIALHPDFPARPYVYAYVTRDVSGTTRIQIIRYETSRRDGTGTGVHPRVIYQSATEAGPRHVGGRMLFGRDGYLYVVIGDAGTASFAQDLSVERGKILRMTARGAPAPGNPFGTRVWSFGHRNSFGFDFDPKTGDIWQTENGPACNDEVNRIVPGGNYAWGPHQTCSTPPAAPTNTNQDGPDPRRLPALYFTPTIAPTGLVFCRDCGLGRAAEGALFFGSFNDGDITRATLTSGRRSIAFTRPALDHGLRVLSMETSPRGRLYFSDGKAIYRLISAA